MKHLSILFLVVMLFGCGVKAQKKELYCNRETSKDWKFEGSSYSLCSYLFHNGKWYEDTTDRPPCKRLKQLMLSKESPEDTITESVYCDNLIETVFKVTECKNCELKEVPGYTELCHTQYLKQAIYQDILTKKRYVSNSGFVVADIVNKLYYDRGRKPFLKSVTIWGTK